VRAPSRATGVIIETERLRMRAHRDDDLADLVVLAGNWEIARWTSTIPRCSGGYCALRPCSCSRGWLDNGEPRCIAFSAVIGKSYA
jgi:hypothetical protein